MQHHLTLYTVTIGSLGFCLWMLATGWVLGRLAGPQKKLLRGTDRNDNDPNGHGYDPFDREDCYVTGVNLVGGLGKPYSNGTKLHSARRVAPRREGQRRAS